MGQRVYVQVLLPLKLEWTPWYCTEEAVRVGQRVEVIFARKARTGVIVRISGQPDIDPSKVERLQNTDTGLPDITPNELRLWDFISNYYLCTPGEVFKAAYPASKLRSECIGVQIDRRAVQSRERMEAALQRKVDTLAQRLLAKEEQLRSRAESGRKVKPELTERLKAERNALASQLEKAKDSLGLFRAGNAPASPANAPAIQETAPATPANDAAIQETAPTTPANAPATPSASPAPPAPAPGGKPLLLRGPHRLAEYFRRCKECLAAGRDVLVLEPESELGLNIEEEFARHFSPSGTPAGTRQFHAEASTSGTPAGTILRIYNASTTPAEKRRIASELRGPHEPILLIGQRSALFLPYSSLGLIIVDEEQDASYKQAEPAPRYNGRDLAAVLASISGAGLILGSSCPSLETLLNVRSGKYDLLDLPDAAPAKVEIIDINQERRKNGMVGDFSRKAIEAVRRKASDALITIVRCFRSEEQTAEQVRELFPERDPQILTAYAARKSPKISDLTIVMQADALFDRDDFRADEKALQLLTMLKNRTRHLIVQTGAGSHPVFAALAGSSSEDALLAERKQFALPPFTRIVDIHDIRTGQLIDRCILPRDRNLAAAKAKLLSHHPGAWFDVDPL